MVEHPPPPDTAFLQAKSRFLRREILTLAYHAKSGHLGSALSVIDILTVLYYAYLKVDPTAPLDPARDRCILSKGHGCSALYVALADRGFFPRALLHDTFIRDGSIFPGHPSAALVPGVDASTGSLGHGLNIGLGMALSGKLDGQSYRTVVIISDGECDEGATWEAVLAAPHWKLGQLTCIVDYNKVQSFGRVEDVMPLEPFVDKWRAFRWHVQEVDGHDHAALLAALQAADRDERPSVIVAHTVKGKGVGFMEDTVDWHYWSLSDAQYAEAMAALPLLS